MCIQYTIAVRKGLVSQDNFTHFSLALGDYALAEVFGPSVTGYILTSLTKSLKAPISITASRMRKNVGVSMHLYFTPSFTGKSCQDVTTFLHPGQHAIIKEQSMRRVCSGNQGWLNIGSSTDPSGSQYQNHG